MKRTKLIILFGISLGFGNSNPDWAKSAIWYQIFPDRFSNGDKSNDPTIETLAGTWPYEKQAEWEITPWMDDWYKLQPWEIGNGQDFYYNAQLRRYGGDIQGIIDKLDYLQDLGVNALYLNPIFESPSAHKYGARFYHHIDNNFGPDPKGDEKIWADENPVDPGTWQWTSADLLFLKLVDEVHKRNMKIIIDGVFNHVGIPFWAFQDVREVGRNSAYSHWFTITAWDDTSTAEIEFDYEGWSGIKDLPVLKEDRNGLISPIQEHIKAVVHRWMDPNGDGDPSDGIDGWRLDVADQVNIEFWKNFRLWVNEINPNAYLTGEVWWDDFWNNKMINAEPWLRGDAFHGVMNYRLADALFKFFLEKKTAISPTEFVDLLNGMINDYGLETFFNLQNVLGSHDTERLASACVNPNRWIDHANNLKYNPEFKVHKPNNDERKLQKLIVAFQFLFPGAPYIYYGDEVGMWGADDPDCRKPMIWEELKYEDESNHPLGLYRKIDTVESDEDLFFFYKRMIELRKNFPALVQGDFKVLHADNDTGLLVISRKYNSQQILGIFNRTDYLLNYFIPPLNSILLDGEILFGNDNRRHSINRQSFQLIICK